MKKSKDMLSKMLEELIPNPKELRYIRIRETVWLWKACEYQGFRHWNSRRTPSRTVRGFWRGK